MARLYIHPTARMGSLANQQVLDINSQLASMTIENDLRREMRENIRRLRDMGTHRGRRHAMGLPVRGQRTRTQVRKGYHFFFFSFSLFSFFFGAPVSGERGYTWTYPRFMGG